MFGLYAVIEGLNKRYWIGITINPSGNLINLADGSPLMDQSSLIPIETHWNSLRSCLFFYFNSGQRMISVQDECSDDNGYICRWQQTMPLAPNIINVQFNETGSIRYCCEFCFVFIFLTTPHVLRL